MHKYSVFIIIIIFAFLLPVRSNSQGLYKLVQDSVYIHVYDAGTASWSFSGAIYYYGEPGFVDSTLTLGSDLTPISKTLYQYANGLLIDGLTLVYISGDWINSQHQVFVNDSNHRLENTVTKWVDGQWQNLNRFTYFYDQDGYQIVNNREYWMNNMWTDYSADSLFYDELGRIILRSVRLKSSNVYITRSFHYYNIYGKRSSQLRQDWINNEWVNVTRTSYYYNPCGTQTSTETEKWSDGSWQPDSRSDIYYHVELTSGTKKVPICHNGKTRYVSINALDGFLARGACLGECTEESYESISFAGNEANIGKKLPFIVYPNPSSDWVTVKMHNDDCRASSIMLLDYSGRVIREIDPGGSKEIEIDLSYLRSGNYILKVTADTVYSTVISKQ